jgi:hypothetical protein
MRLRFWLLVATLVCGPRVYAQPVIVSNAEVPCRGCSLRIDSVATIGRGQAVGEYFRGQQISVIVKDRLATSSTVPIQLFDLRGRFLGLLGREGQGPGEFPAWITGLASGPSNTLYAFVPRPPLAIVFDSALKFVRNVSLAKTSRNPTVLSNGNFAGLNQFPPSPSRPPDSSEYAKTYAQPLFHVFSSTGAYLRSVGTSLSLADNMIAAGFGGTIWTAKDAPYELKQWSQDGALLRVIQRVTSFFGRSRYLGRWPFIAAQITRPNLANMFQDQEGLLWVAIRVVKPTWNRSMQPFEDFCCETIIEVLDPANGTLFGTARIALPVQRIMEHGYLAGVATGRDGEPLLVLYRAQLTRPPR